jgi:hypothetical protein
MYDLRLPQNEAVYAQRESITVFNQLAVKIEMDSVSNERYFAWLDKATQQVGSWVRGAQIAEKANARTNPPLNTAIYYDTLDYRILRTGALLRTSCNKITHAFCAFKAAQDEHSVRRDHRYVFSGTEKQLIQADPAAPAAVAVVKHLLARKDIAHPGTFLETIHGIPPEQLEPAIHLDDYRYTFFVWLDEQDALRCSIDRATVSDLRKPEGERVRVPVSEVELAIYPRVSEQVAQDERLVKVISALAESLSHEFDVKMTTLIKYQRAAQALGIR